MKKPFGILFSLVLVSVQFLFAQKPTVEVLTTGNKTSLRGLSVVNDNVIWVSGSAGIVGKSSNGGKNWKWMTVKGFEKTEFRDIEAFDGSTAIIMAIAEPAYILKTTDGGENWKVVYENKTKGMFLDAMDFFNGEHGIVVGDPINSKIFLAATADGGETWKEIEEKRPVADSGEAFFAASGSNIRLFGSEKTFLVSGGTKSRLFTSSGVIDLPILQGKETTGANSIDVYHTINMKATKQMVVVGGDFNADSSTEKNCFITTNGGKTWKAPKEPPHGYRSCVEYLSKDDLLSCGLNGVDYSFNGGKNWQWISKEGFHVCRIAKTGTAIFLAGNNGKIGKVVWR
ncbi:MAG: oxidoreductase [Chitinophagaceae bacterium]|nr:oxidoreductase [Chitinophagaceae bacterium]